MRAGDGVGALGVERSGSCRHFAEELAEAIGAGINQMLGVRAREGCRGLCSRLPDWGMVTEIITQR